MPRTTVRTTAVLFLAAAGMTGISMLSACVTAVVPCIPGHRLTAESAVPAAAVAPVSIGISIHTHSPLFLFDSVFILYYVRRLKLCPFSPDAKPAKKQPEPLDSDCLMFIWMKGKTSCILFYASVVSSGFLSRISMNSSPVMVSFSSR